MAVTFIGKLNFPNYSFLNSDINLDGTVDGVSIIGAICYVTDTFEWKIVLSDLTVGEWTLPVEVTVSSEIEIGKIVIKDDTTATTAAVGANGLAVDAYINKIDQSVAESTTLSPLYTNQAVSVPGTAEPLAASSTKVIMALVMARTTNLGEIFIGTAAVDKDSSKQMTLAPGATVSIDAPLGFNFNLNSWYVDATNANDAVDIIAMR